MSPRRVLLCVVLLLSAALPAAPAAAQYSRAILGGNGGSGSGGRGFSGIPGGIGGGFQRGGFGAARPPDGNLALVVAQTQDVHREVGNLLDQLRRLQDQQVAVSTPFHTINDNFFERMGVGFGFSIKGSGQIPSDDGGRSAVVGLNPDGSFSRNINFGQGSFGSAQPPFGGNDVNTNARTGFGVLGNEVDLFFNFDFGQGSSRSQVTQVPTVTMFNGTQGTVSDTSQIPFVTGIIPVVGGFRPPVAYAPARSTSPLFDRIQRLHQQGGFTASRRSDSAGRQLSPEDKLTAKIGGARGGDSSADHGDLSVAEIRLRRQAEQDQQRQELLALIERGRGAEEAGKFGAARVLYRQAFNRADGELKQQLSEKLRALNADN